MTFSLAATTARHVKYYAFIFVVIAGLTIASFLVIQSGGQSHLRMSFNVAGNAKETSTRPRITLKFDRNVSEDSVKAHLQLLPETPFTLTWRERVVELAPSTPLKPATTYTLSLSSVEDASGSPLAGNATWSFTTRPARVAYLASAKNETQNVGLYVLNLATQKSQIVSTFEQNVQDFTIAPDGNVLIYSAAEPSQTRLVLWSVDLNTGQRQQITDEENVVYGSMKWSPAGDVLAYEERRIVEISGQEQLSSPRIALLRPNGTKAGTIYGQNSDIAHTPVWSPDGTRLAFYDPQNNEVIISNFTDNLRKIPANAGNVGSWAPNGQAIVVPQLRQEALSVRQFLQIYSLATQDKQVIEEPVGQMNDPAWAPAGDWIAYAFQPPFGMGLENEVVIVRPNGSERRVLVHYLDAIVDTPTWSPTGEWLVFTQLALNEADARSELWQVRPDGSELRRIAEDGFLAQWIP